MFGNRSTKTSQYETITNKIYSWRSSDQNFFYYDKESQSNVPLEKGAKLIPLTCTQSVTGMHEQDHGKATRRYNRVYSNEFTDYSADIVTVKEYDRLDETTTVIAQGTYSGAVKNIISDLPYAKFTKNVYCLMGDEIVKLVLSGSSLLPWFDIENKLTKADGFMTLTLDGAEEQKNGAVTFYSPKFSLTDVPEKENETLIELREDTNDKIEANKRASGATADAPTEFDPAAVKAATAATQPQPAAKEEPIDLSEIPF